MLVFDYKCPACGIKVIDKVVRKRNEIVKCKQCHAKMKRLFVNNVTHHLFPNGGIHLEHVSPEGETFHSQGEMKKYAKKHDLELGALL